MTTQRTYKAKKKKRLSEFEQHQKGVLEAKLAELQKEHQGARTNLAVNPGELAEDYDRANAFANQDVTVGNINRSALEIRHVQDALRALEAGAYGTCNECGEPIPEKRLQAIPWAERCVSCEEVFAQEAEGVMVG
ncbi:MAG: TraR/DksA family transcriptional regulator [Candidatus Paceibacterota bacterium]